MYRGHLKNWQREEHPAQTYAHACLFKHACMSVNCYSIRAQRVAQNWTICSLLRIVQAAFTDADSASIAMEAVAPVGVVLHKTETLKVQGSQ